MSGRSKVWRRFQAKIIAKKSYCSTVWKPGKNWKFLYTRSIKLQRAKQLGIEYPRKTGRQTLNIDE